MLPAPLFDDEATWKQRYRAEQSIASLARFAPTRGLVASNRSGQFQLYAWDVPSGNLKQLTSRPHGTLFGSISPDGRFIYYFDDQLGNELGHFKRLPFEGGSPVDMTPGLPPHSMSSGEASPSSRLFGLTVPTTGGFDCYVVAQDDTGPTGEPRLRITATRLPMALCSPARATLRCGPLPGQTSMPSA